MEFKNLLFTANSINNETDALKFSIFFVYSALVIGVCFEFGTVVLLAIIL